MNMHIAIHDYAAHTVVVLFAAATTGKTGTLNVEAQSFNQQPKPMFWEALCGRFLTDWAEFFHGCW